MKYLKLLSFAALGLLTFSSCNDDDSDDDPQVIGPSLSVTETTSGETNGGMITIEQGQIIGFVWDARKGALDMDEFAVSISGVNAVSPIPTSAAGNDFPYELSNADDELYVDSLVFATAGDNVGITNYTFSVTDTDGNRRNVSFEVETISSMNALSSPQDFTWIRVGSNVATGLSQFGLSWTQNSSTSAIIVEDNAATMVTLDADDWTNLTSVEQLNEAIANAPVITEYTGVSATTDGTYSDYLGVVYNNEPYILSIEQGVVTTGSAGTTITINGRYKN